GGGVPLGDLRIGEAFGTCVLPVGGFALRIHLRHSALKSADLTAFERQWSAKFLSSAETLTPRAAAAFSSEHVSSLRSGTTPEGIRESCRSEATVATADLREPEGIARTRALSLRS